MDKGTREQVDEPVWARPDSFPVAPEGCGWMDPKGCLHPVDDFDSLLKAVANDASGRVILVWNTDHSHLVLPEELHGAEQAVRCGRALRMEDAIRQTRARLWWASGLLSVIALHQFWSLWGSQPSTAAGIARLYGVVTDMFASIPLGMGMLLWFALVFMPWYEARKEYRLWNEVHARDSGHLIAGLRFDTWLMLQRASLTRILAVCMTVIWLFQWGWVPAAAVTPAAGLVKPAYEAGEIWRLLTAPWLHGNWVHFAFNLLALLYLGKRVELFARWPHLLTVLLFSTLAGGVCSARFVDAASVGISGGLMGWLGFLLVFETLHHRLVTRSARRRLLAGVLLTALMGFIGYRLIDNAAHLGGLVAGMAYGGIVFPSSSSIHRPKVLWIDRVAGGAAALALAGGLVFTVMRLVQFT